MVAKLIRVHIGEQIPRRFATNCRVPKTIDLLRCTNYFRQKSARTNANGHGEATDFLYCLRWVEGVDLREETMAPYGEAKADARLATQKNNHCPQCSASLLAPSWSEHLNERCVRHTWACDACGYEFETAVFFPALERAAA